MRGSTGRTASMRGRWPCWAGRAWDPSSRSAIPAVLLRLRLINSGRGLLKHRSLHGKIIVQLFLSACKRAGLWRAVGVLGKGVTDAAVAVVLSYFANVFMLSSCNCILCPFYTICTCLSPPFLLWCYIITILPQLSQYTWPELFWFLLVLLEMFTSCGFMLLCGLSLLQQMWNQEKNHLKKFSELMVAYRVRPTVLLPFWNVAGFVLGESG